MLQRKGWVQPGPVLLSVTIVLVAGLLAMVPGLGNSGNRAQGPHESALFDIEAKYGDVLSTDETIELLLAAQFSE